MNGQFKTPKKKPLDDAVRMQYVLASYTAYKLKEARNKNHFQAFVAYSMLADLIGDLKAGLIIANLIMDVDNILNFAEKLEIPEDETDISSFPTDKIGIVN